MCEYCIVGENGDIEYNAIIDPSCKSGITCESGVDAGYKTLISSIYVNNIFLKEFSQDINYCPMCGRKL